MPIQEVTRIDPLDLQKNVAIGVSLPFNSSEVFKSTYSTQDQIKSNLINLLLSNKGERIMNPEFGADISYMLFEGMVDENIPLIQSKIADAISIFIPQIQADTIDVIYDQDHYTINVVVKYRLILSGKADQITIELK
jgi:phage baseplate assembly protein W